MSTKISNLLRSCYNTECTRCDLHQNVRNVCVRGRGQFGERILFIAEAPGEQEDKEGIALVGKAGGIFNRCLDAIGMTEEDYYATNIVKCRPPGNRTPSTHEVSRCRKYLYREIRTLDPEYIVLLGASAIKATFGKGATVKAYRGKITEWNGYKVFCTLHPSSVNYEPYNERLIVDDLNILVRHLNGSHKPEKVKYVFSHGNDNYVERIDRLAEERVLSVDIEATGLDIYAPDFRILSSAFSSATHKGDAFLLDHTKRVMEHLPIIKRLDKCIFRRSKGILVGHNIKFDLLGFKRVGLEYDGKVRDTMVMAHLLDENNPDKSLEALAMRDTDMGAYKSNVRAERDAGDMESLSVHDLLYYNCQDTDATKRLDLKYLPQIKEQGMMPLLDFQMEELKMLVDIEWTGWMIDWDEYKRLKKEYKEKIREKRDELWEYSGEINLNSSKQKAKFVYDELGFKVLEDVRGGRTKGGDPSISKDILKMLCWNAKGTRKKILEGLIEYTTLVKRATFFPQVKANMKDDGKIHASYRQTKNQWGDKDDETGGTVTGRLSVKNPNVQQIPREGDIKRMFVSQWEHGRIVQGDHSQMELRILAEQSRDRKMVRIFKEGDIDIHRRVGSWIFKKAEEEVTDKQRKYTKKVNFGISYMIGPQGLSHSLSEEAGHMVSEGEAKRFIKQWFSEFPQVETWIAEMRKELIRYGEVQTPFGRKRRLAETNPSTSKGREGIRQGVNFLIQSLASDITLYRAVEFWRWLREEGMKSKIVGLIHDAVVLDCPKKEVMKVARKMKKVMENNDFTEPFGFKMTVPLKMDIHQGKSWADKKEIKLDG